MHVSIYVCMLMFVLLYRWVFALCYRELLGSTSIDKSSAFDEVESCLLPLIFPGIREL